MTDIDLTKEQYTAIIRVWKSILIGINFMVGMKIKLYSTLNFPAMRYDEV